MNVYCPTRSHALRLLHELLLKFPYLRCDIQKAEQSYTQHRYNVICYHPTGVSVCTLSDAEEFITAE